METGDLDKSHGLAKSPPAACHATGARCLLEDRIIQRSIPELLDLDRLAGALVGRASLETLCTVHWQDIALPVRALTLGAVEPEAPLLLCVGGVHGLERIGAQVVLGFIETLVAALRWRCS